MAQDQGSEYTLKESDKQANFSVKCTAHNSRGTSSNQEDIMPMLATYAAQVSSSSVDYKLLILIIVLVVVILLFGGIYGMMIQKK